MLATLGRRTFQAVGRKLPKTRRRRVLMSSMAAAAVFLFAWWLLTPAAPKIVFLSDLDEELTGTPGKLFVRNGNYKYVEVQKIDGQVKYLDKTAQISLNGTRKPKGIFMRPPQQGSISATYRLDKQFKTFKSTVALADGSGGTEQVFFNVLYDKGKWQSKEFKLPRQTEECEIDVRGVDKLELSVGGRGAHFPESVSCWLDPRLELVPSWIPFLLASGLGLLVGAGVWLAGR